MGAARPVGLNFAVSLVQTTTFRLEDRNWLEHNLEATRRFLGRLGPPSMEVHGTWPMWDGVSWRELDSFLADYYSDPGSGMMDVTLIRRYINDQVQHDELLRWTVCVCTQSQAVLGAENLGIVGYGPINTISRTRLRSNPRSIGSLVNPRDARRRSRIGR